MKKFLAITLIVVTFLLTYAFWALEQPAKTVSIYRQYSQLIASMAMVALAWINYISTRHRWVDDIFNGLDKSYIYHKYLSILAIIFIWIHNFTVNMSRFSGERRPGGRPSGMGIPPEEFKSAGRFSEGAASGILGIHIERKMLGSLSMYIFTAFIIFFLIAYKLEYQKWKTLHKLMLVPYAIGIIHYYLDSDYTVFALTAYSIWMNFINAIGILSAIYMIFIYEITAFKYRYKVSNIKEIAKDTIEITGISTDGEMRYKPGQFAFMKLLGRNNKFPSHPFTMSQALRPGEIQFSVKVLGNHTANLKYNLALGDIIAVSGPFGKFNYRSGTKRQIWLAGGI